MRADEAPPPAPTISECNSELPIALCAFVGNSGSSSPPPPPPQPPRHNNLASASEAAAAPRPLQTNAGSTRASSRKNRVYVLRKFLLETYPSVFRRHADSIVVDCAGGKGDLSFLLANADGVDAVVADPRVPDHTHLVKSVRYLVDRPEEAARRAVPGRPSHQPLAELIPILGRRAEFETPRHLRLLVDDELVHVVREVLAAKEQGDDCEERWEAFWSDAQRRASVAQPLGYPQDYPSGATGGRIDSAAAALEAILGASLFVGFHPDQATGALVDLALLLRVPFACVPCCAFPSQFPDRHLEDGSRVRNYDGLLKWLRKRHPSIRETALAFHESRTARNVVLYMLPEDFVT